MTFYSRSTPTGRPTHNVPEQPPDMSHMYRFCTLLPPVFLAAVAAL